MAPTDDTQRQHDEIGVRTDVLADLPSVTATPVLDHQSFDATYYDTKDLRLAQAGVRVCRLTTGESVEWRATLPLGSRQPREATFPVVDSQRDLVPADLRALLVAHTLGRGLRPCAQVATERDRWRLTDADGGVIAEVVGDQVIGRALGRPAVGVTSWREIEIEPRGGSPDLLKQVSKRLAHTGTPGLRHRSPLARILRTHRNGVVELSKKASVADVLGRYLHDQIAALRTADLALRLDEPDALHDLRVSTRRLRNCVRVFGKYFEPASVRPARAELAWLSGVLGDARDVEVVRGRVSRSLRALPEDLVLGPVSVELDRLLAKREARAANAVHAAITSSRYLALLNTLDNLLAGGSYRPVAEQRAKKVLPRQIGKSYRKVRAAVDDASGLRGQENDVALHSVRKKVKRLRHACEAVEPVIGKPTKRMRRRSQRIQRTLGDHHDSVEIRRVLRELGSRAHLDGGNGFTFGLLYGQAGERAAQLEEEFAEQWRSLTKPKVERWMRGHGVKRSG